LFVTPVHSQCCSTPDQGGDTTVFSLLLDWALSRLVVDRPDPFWICVFFPVLFLLPSVTSRLRSFGRHAYSTNSLTGFSFSFPVVGEMNALSILIGLARPPSVTPIGNRRHRDWICPPMRSHGLVLMRLLLSASTPRSSRTPSCVFIT